MADTDRIIQCEDLVRIYKTREIEVVALQGLDLTVGRGEMMAIIGNSGSGKSTLLNILGGLDTPSAGLAQVDGKTISALSPKELRRYKSETVGFVWQNSARNLIPYLTAQENVELPMRILGKADKKYAADLLDYVGLSDKRKHRLYELSGGEQQRVAAAIALSNRPSVLLADEPTGALDTRTTKSMLELLKRVNAEWKLTVVIVTHDRQVASYVDRVVAIRNGKTSSEFIRRRYAAELADLEHERLTLAPSHEETHEEFALLDKAGRVQIPSAYMQALGVKGTNKVKVSLEEEKVVIERAEG